MPDSTCFSYSLDVPPGIRDRNAAQWAARDLRRMPTGSGFFSYPEDEPPGIRDRDAVQGSARDLSGTPGETSGCFSY